MGEARQDTRQFAFLLVDKFSMFSLAAAIDTVRSANRLLGRDVYSWVTVSADGEAVMASNGLPIKIDYAIADLPPVDILFVCVGLTTEFPGKSTVLAGLRSLGRRGAALGALAAGSYLLAEAGQLEGHRCTIHWENRASFMERFPEIECTGNVYEIDRKRYTCAGVTTSIDLMLEIVRNDLGVELANEVANQFQHERIRSPGDRQRTGPERDLTGKSEKLKRKGDKMFFTLLLLTMITILERKRQKGVSGQKEQPADNERFPINRSGRNGVREVRGVGAEW